MVTHLDPLAPSPVNHRLTDLCSKSVIGRCILWPAVVMTTMLS